MPGQGRILLEHLDRSINGAAVGVPENHHQGDVKEADRVFHAGKPSIINEVAGQTHNEDIAGSLVETSSGATRESAQPRTAAIGNCACARATRPAEKSRIVGVLAA